jgi:hypothetical protein
MSKVIPRYQDIKNDPALETINFLCDGHEYELEVSAHDIRYKWLIVWQYINGRPNLIVDMRFDHNTESAYVSYNIDDYDDQPVSYYEFIYKDPVEIGQWLIATHPEV